MEETKKKIGKLTIIGLLALVLVGGIVAAVGGYKLFTAVSHFNVQEAMEVQYWDGANWQPLAVNGATFDLGTATIKAGETNSFVVRARNTASNGVLGLVLNIESTTGITNDIQCYGAQSTGLQYTKGPSVFYFKAPADSTWRAIQIDTTTSGDIETGSIEFDNTLTRNNALDSYVATCP